MISSSARWKARSAGRAAGVALVSALLLARPSWAAPPNAEGTPSAEDARSRFAEAVKLFKQGDIERALPLFEELAGTTRSPNAHLYVGHCLKKKERWSAAHGAFSAAVEESTRLADPKYEATRNAARAELEALEVRVAKLVVVLPEAPEELSLRVDGVAFDRDTLGSEWVLDPGSHRLEAAGRGVEPIARTVAIEAGETRTVSLTFERAMSPGAARAPEAEHGATSPSRAELRTLGFVAGGVGVAGVAVWTIFGLQAKSTYDELERDCPEGCSDAKSRERIESGKSSQTVANVGLAVGAVGLAASGVLLYLGFSGEEASPTVAFSPGSASLSYRGRF